MKDSLSIDQNWNTTWDNNQWFIAFFVWQYLINYSKVFVLLISSYQSSRCARETKIINWFVSTVVYHSLYLDCYSIVKVIFIKHFISVSRFSDYIRKYSVIIWLSELPVLMKHYFLKALVKLFISYCR